jgi:GMP synthase-like glutamine amidotransferase
MEVREGIGVISFMKRGGLPPALRKAVEALQLEVELFDAGEKGLVEKVRASPLRRWILTGSAWDIDARGAPQIPEGLFELASKRFLLICYSHESLLWRMGVPLQRSGRVKGWAPIDITSKGRGLFQEGGGRAEVWCNYNTWARAEDIPRGWKILATMGPAAMAIQRGPVTSVQFHPEMIAEDEKVPGLLKRWLRVRP